MLGTQYQAQYSWGCQNNVPIRQEGLVLFFLTAKRPWGVQLIAMQLFEFSKHR
jgi:hypothetical protein